MNTKIFNIFIYIFISVFFFNCAKKNVLINTNTTNNLENINPFLNQKFDSLEATLNINITSNLNNLNNFFIGKLYFNNDEYAIYIYSPFFTNILIIHQKGKNLNILNRFNNILYKLDSFSFKFSNYDFSFFFKIFNYCLNINNFAFENEIKEPEYKFIYENNLLSKIISPQNQIVEFNNYQKFEEEKIFYFPEIIILNDLTYDIVTTIEFKNIKINKEINSKKFELPVNEKTKIIDKFN